MADTALTIHQFSLDGVVVEWLAQKKTTSMVSNWKSDSALGARAGEDKQSRRAGPLYGIESI